MDFEWIENDLDAEPPVVWETLKPAQSHLYTWVRKADRRFAQSFGRLLREIRLIDSEWAALRELYKPRSSSPVELSVAIGMSKGGASKLIGRLVKKGLVAKLTADFDRRFRSVYLTRQGRELVAFLAPLERAADREFFGPMGNNRRYRLMEWMKALLNGARSQHMGQWVSTQLTQNTFPKLDADAHAKDLAKAEAEADALSEYCKRVAEAAALGTTPPSWESFCELHPWTQ